MAGAAAVPPSEIEAWSRLRRIALAPFEAQALLALDADYVAYIVAKQQKTLPRQDVEGLKTLIDGSEPEHVKRTPRKARKSAGHAQS